MTGIFNYSAIMLLLPLFVFAFTGYSALVLNPAFRVFWARPDWESLPILSNLTAYRYFFGQGPVDGIFPQLIPYNILWLQFTDKLSIHMGITSRSHFGNDDGSYHNRIFHGAPLQHWIYAWRVRLCPILCVSVPFTFRCSGL